MPSASINIITNKHARSGIKTFSSKNYNYIFNFQSGSFARWGKNKEDDPLFSPHGPELLDIEISTICHQGCSFCYKGNNKTGKYMSLDVFKQIFDKLPKTLTQIAFGIGDIDSNPDMYKIFRHCRKNAVIPNVTINGMRMKKIHYDRLVDLCGAVAVSNYNKDVCYNTVKELTSRGLKQTNIHMLLSDETYIKCIDLLYDKLGDERLKRLNAIVFLWLKPKGPRNNLSQVRRSDFNKLVSVAMRQNIPIGFDSCSAPMFLEAIETHQQYKAISTLVEPCESSLFSLYVNVDGIAFPCSFTEGETPYKGVDILNCKDFIKDVWKSKEISFFRKRCLRKKNHLECRMCTQFNLGKE